jgi:transcriptional/translational regulatory protein YebC/TACO1
VADVRHALAKHGGNLGTSGSVAFQFRRVGEIVVDTSKAGSEDTVLETALDAGADDVSSENGATLVLAAPDAFEAVRKALAGAGLDIARADVVMRPENRIAVSGEAEETLRELLAWLDELDDVQEVYHNAAMPD